MNKTLPFLHLLIFVMLSFFACTSGKRAMLKGNYDEALYKAVNRLRSNTDHRKSGEILKQTYPLAVQWHRNKIKAMEASYERFKWEGIAREYQVLRNLSDEISRCPSCLGTIPSPENFNSEYEHARLQAASDRYDAGLAALEKGKRGDRNEAKDAYWHFTEADKWLRGYKDAEEKMKEAQDYATISVVVEPIPMHSQTLKISNEFFDNKINEFLLSAPINRFVRFYTAREAKRLGLRKPDQIIQLSFDDFVVGQTYMHEKETQLVRDSIVLATYQVDVPQTQAAGQVTASASSNGEAKVTICHNASGGTQTITVAESALRAHLDHGDKIGPCSGGDSSNPATPGSKKETRKVYGQAKATMHQFTKTVESKGLLDLRILDGRTGRVMTQQKLPGVYVWQSEWGYFNGDERALNKQQLQIIRNKEVPSPLPQDLFIAFTQPIFQQLTSKINDYYRNF